MTDVTPETIAQLARAHTTTLEEAASLIQSYADAYASGEVIKAIEQQHARNMAILEAPLVRITS